MSRQHVEIIDGKEYTVTTLPQESRVAPSLAVLRSGCASGSSSPTTGSDSRPYICAVAVGLPVGTEREGPSPGPSSRQPQRRFLST
jgi:hypothetical protein